MHDLIAAGVAAARQRKRWTQEDAARAFREVGLTTWRTSTVGSLESGLRRPRLDEVVLMCAALDVGLDELLPGDEEPVELADGTVLTPRAIRAVLAGEASVTRTPPGLRPRDMRWAAYVKFERQANREFSNWMKDRERRQALVEPIIEDANADWLTGADEDLMFEAPTDAERHAARRLGVEPIQIKTIALTHWRKDFEAERDTRVGDTGELSPRSRQARRGLVTRQMLDEMRVILDRAYSGQGADG